MKIGFSTCVLDSGQTGISTYIRELLRFLQLEDEDDAFELLMPRGDADLIPLKSPNFSRRLYPTACRNPLLSLAWHNAALPVLSRHLDLIHIPTARRIPLIKGTKVLATVHDLAAFSVDGKYDAARMAFNRRLVPAMIRRADHIIAVSEFTKNDLMHHVGVPEEKISVIYSGIDRDLFKPAAPGEAREMLQMLHGLERPFFVYVARLEHPGKNHVRLIEAFERFKMENDSSHQLVLAGADWNGAEIIRARASESPVHEDIVFPGFVPKKSLPLLYSACDLMVFPSLFEGFGFPIVEALACGAPVICSDSSSMREVAGAQVPTFDPLNSEAIFRSMERAVSAGRDKAAAARGMEYASRFDWRATAQRVMEIYRSMV